MSDAIQHECGIAHIRLLKPLDFYKERTEPHKENLREDYNRVSLRALEEKKAKVLESWFKDKVPNYYVFIDNDFQACKELTDWTKVANAIVKEKTY